MQKVFTQCNVCNRIKQDDKQAGWVSFLGLDICPDDSGITFSDLAAKLTPKPIVAAPKPTPVPEPQPPKEP